VFTALKIITENDSSDVSATVLVKLATEETELISLNSGMLLK
jgi:hypothetical protein